MEVGMGLGAFTLALCALVFSFMAAPASAQAFWWPWWKHAHAQEDNTVTVSIQKYIDGSLATSESGDGLAFPMNASWDDPDGIGAGDGSYTLSADNSYKAETTEMQEGADYSTNERLTEANVGASCADGKPYALVGYTTGASLAAAQAGTATTTAPAFTNLTDDAYVIVWNETCDDNEEPAGDLVGTVTGGVDGDVGELTVTSIEAEDTTAVANGTFADGWKYVFKVTVPTDEPNVSMKFNDWLHSNGTNTIPVANNMRISSAQASATSTVLLTAEDTYSSPALTMVDDLDSGTDGIQVEVLVEVAVPAGTLNGTYSTDYGIQSVE